MIHFFDRSRIEVEHIRERFLGFVSPEPMSGCWLWTGTLTINGWQGYGRFTVAGVKFVAHQVSWELWHGHIPPKLFVLHKCDNRQCVNPAHLFLGTYKDNIQDCMAKGRRGTPQGTAAYNAVLNDAKVLEIRSLKSTMSQRQIAKLFGVTQHTIMFIHQGRSWKHV